MDLLLDNAVVFDGERTWSGRGWAVVDGGVVVSVGAAAEAPPLEVKRRIDLEGKTLMPGLIDAHVHLCLDASVDPAGFITGVSAADLALHASAHAAATLAAGVTTVRDLGGRSHVDLSVRDAVAAGMIAGPRILAAGEMICMTGGHGWMFGRQADGPDEVRKAVREQLRAGADVIKFMATGGICTEGVEPGQAQLGPDELKAGVVEAHRAGRPAAAHAQGLAGVKNALSAGMDTIEHGTYLDDEAAGWMAERGVFLVPTLAAGAHMLAGGQSAGLADFMVDKSRRHRAARLESLARAKAAGVRVAWGTDAGTPLNRHGRNAQELAEMVRAGFSPRQALVAATSVSAQLIGWPDRLGRVAAGYLADLLVVDGDPAGDPEVLADPDRVAAVFQSGRLVAGTWARPVVDVSNW
jgi:imidazolonepropionase-like amidohydrolase